MSDNWYCKVSAHKTYEVETKYKNGEILIENLKLNYYERVFGPPYSSGRAINLKGGGKSASFSFPGHVGKATMGFKLEEGKSYLDKVTTYLVVDLSPLYKKYHETHEAFDFVSGNLASDGRYAPSVGYCMQGIASSIGTFHVDFSELLGLNSILICSGLTEKEIDQRSDLVKKLFTFEEIKILEPPKIEKLEEKAKLPFVTKNGLETYPLSVNHSYNQALIERMAIKKLALEKYLTKQG